jgi:2-amino-4-hydroxy-6-hydroxymethyldihydropteridine diphosphokinase
MSLDTVTAYLLLGSNLGKREWYLDQAVRLISEEAGAIVATSSTYETAAWGKTDQPGFLNRAIGIETKLTPIALLNKVLAIEKSLGRIREEKWGARFIDIDIILYGNEVVSIADELQIPHPHMQNRKFVMQPLVEIAPHLKHPILKISLTEILVNLKDPLIVLRLAQEEKSR